MKARAKVTLINAGHSIKQAMHSINEQPQRHAEAPGGVALVVDKKDKLVGVVTDGDIRRALLSGASLEDSIEKAMNRNPITFRKDLGPDELLVETIREINRRNIRNKRLDIIITVDEKGRPYDVFRFFDLWKNSEIKTRVVSIIGLGYVGLTLGLVLAEAGFKVVGVDRNRKVVSELNKRKSHIHEQGVDGLLHRHLGKNFFAQAKFKNNDSDIYIVCVGTSVDEKGKVRPAPLLDALAYITGLLKKGDLVVLRSTVSVGTSRNLVIPLLEKRTGMKAGEDFYVSFAPERTVEGKALIELRELPQVIGGFNKTSADMTAKLFNHLTSSIVSVEDLETAELVKLLNNSYRDLTFSFANEVALISDAYKLNTQKVIQAANYGYKRSTIPMPSPGVGGYCLPKDPYILVESARAAGVDARLPKLSREINNKMIDHVCQKIDEFLKDHGKKRAKIFLVGLAFKGDPETRDTRGSTSVAIAKKLSKKYPNLFVFDPVLKRTDILAEGFRAANLKRGFRNADCVLILNNHESYRDMDIHSFLDQMRKPGLLFDAWYMFADILSEPIEGIEHKGL